MISEKMKTKNVRNPHTLRTLTFPHFFELLKNSWDFIWLRDCLNKFITLRRCSNDFQKNQNPKILKIKKGMKNVRNPHILRTLPILHFFEFLKFFGEFIWVGWCLNKFITLRRWWNDFQKNPKQKILKN